ncbi:C-X-C motif chemokine 11-1-like [Oncorhynchus clarkii lewisi]|uniref:C-X-C motif chemokine 11-1-like n=1 Tax=Oncorhynchus clarkii lewisi TaxID=490388 RepID=UPI0039B84ADC
MTNTMTLKVLISFLACLLLANVEGQVGHSKARCLCLNGLVNRVKPLHIEKLEVYTSSHSCRNMEIIVTLKNGEGKKCLNPEAPFAKKTIEKIMKKRRFADFITDSIHTN